MATTTPLRIGTRGSKLARWQSDWVAAQLRLLGATAEIVEIKTHGDVQSQGSVASLGVTGVFTKEIQAAVRDGRVDVAVHSLKDLPTASVDGLTLAAVPSRGDSADALVAADASSLDELPAGARIGTGSLRRQAQLLALRPDLKVAGIRGNVDTRLRKLDDGEYDAIVLAAAGLQRLGLQDRITELLSPPRMLPAPGQGALGVECRSDNSPLLKLLDQLHDAQTHACVVAERTLLATLEGGCSAPIAAWGRIADDQIALDGLVASLDGKTLLRASQAGEISAPKLLGEAVAAELVDAGAAAIVAAARS